MRLGLGCYTYMRAVGVPDQRPLQPLDARGLLDRAQELGGRVVQYCDHLPLVRLSARDLDALASAAAEASNERRNRSSRTICRHAHLIQTPGPIPTDRAVRFVNRV